MVKIETELSLYREQVQVMAQKVRHMYVLALEVLETGDKTNALSIVELDEYVNNMNEEINDRAIEILALLNPVAKDLRVVLAGLKMSTDLERIGDYAKNIGRFIIRNDKVNKDLLKYIRPLGEKFLDFFDASINAYKIADAKKAMELPLKDEEIDSSFKALLNFLEDEQYKHIDTSGLIPTISMLRNIERAGDHTKNICEHIIYEVKGQHVDFG